MNIRTEEGMAPVAPDVTDVWVERRKKGGSEMGEKRADRIVGDFENLVGVHVQYATDTLTGMRLGWKETLNRLLEKAGLDGFVEPSSLIGRMPSFRRIDSIEDVKRVVLAAYEKMASLNRENGDGGDDASREVWEQRKAYLSHNFLCLAALAHLDRRYKSVNQVTKVDLGPGEEE